MIAQNLYLKKSRVSLNASYLVRFLLNNPPFASAEESLNPNPGRAARRGSGRGGGGGAAERGDAPKETDGGRAAAGRGDTTPIEKELRIVISG